MDWCGEEHKYLITTIMKEENKKGNLKYYTPQDWVLKKLRMFLTCFPLLAQIGGNERKEFLPNVALRAMCSDALSPSLGVNLDRNGEASVSCLI